MKFIHSINFIKLHSGKCVRMKFETFHNGIKSVHIAAFDYENAWMLWCIFHIQTISSYDSFKDITKQNEIGIKSVHITAFVSSYDSFKDITKQNQIWIKSVHIAALDYEMHEYYDAFSYSNNYFALNDLILILSPIISVWHHVKPNFIQS